MKVCLECWRKRTLGQYIISQFTNNNTMYLTGYKTTTLNQLNSKIRENILHASAFRINQYLDRTAQNQFSGSRLIDFLRSKNIILDSREHSQSSNNPILDSRICSLEHRTKTYLVSCGMIVKAWPAPNWSSNPKLFIHCIYFIILLLRYFDHIIFGAVPIYSHFLIYAPHLPGSSSWGMITTFLLDSVTIYLRTQLPHLICTLKHSNLDRLCRRPAIWEIKAQCRFSNIWGKWVQVLMCAMKS